MVLQITNSSNEQSNATVDVKLPYIHKDETWAMLD